MYPPWLELGEPEQQERQVHFLDLNIWHDGTVWQSKLYDKRIKLEAMGLKLNKFPHVESKLVIKCKYGIITSQLFRYANACTRTKDFLHASPCRHARCVMARARVPSAAWPMGPCTKHAQHAAPAVPRLGRPARF